MDNFKEHSASQASLLVVKKSVIKPVIQHTQSEDNLLEDDLSNNQKSNSNNLLEVQRSSSIPPKSSQRINSTNQKSAIKNSAKEKKRIQFTSASGEMSPRLQNQAPELMSTPQDVFSKIPTSQTDSGVGFKLGNTSSLVRPQSGTRNMRMVKIGDSASDLGSPGKHTLSSASRDHLLNNFQDLNLAKNLEPVDEAQELPEDPKIKYFGRPPLAPYVKVRLDYTPDSGELLRDLTEFIYKHAKMQDFDEGKKDYWESIFKAVLCSSSYEAQVFKTNLDELIAENIAETGYDPRIDGPPDHIANQEVTKKQDDVDDNESQTKKKEKEAKVYKPPGYLKMTKSVERKQLELWNSPNQILRRRMADNYAKTTKSFSQTPTNQRRDISMQMNKTEISAPSGEKTKKNYGESQSDFTNVLAKSESQARGRIVKLNKIRVMLDKLQNMNNQICVDSQVKELKKARLKLYNVKELSMQRAEQREMLGLTQATTFGGSTSQLTTKHSAKNMAKSHSAGFLHHCSRSALGFNFEKSELQTSKANKDLPQNQTRVIRLPAKKLNPKPRDTQYFNVDKALQTHKPKPPKLRIDFKKLRLSANQRSLANLTPQPNHQPMNINLSNASPQNQTTSMHTLPVNANSNMLGDTFGKSGSPAVPPPALVKCHTQQHFWSEEQAASREAEFRSTISQLAAKQIKMMNACMSAKLEPPVRKAVLRQNTNMSARTTGSCRTTI